jgi:hypothetical protein
MNNSKGGNQKIEDETKTIVEAPEEAYAGDLRSSATDVI